MIDSAYGRLSAASFLLATLLLAFSESFAVAICAFGLITVGSVALGIAVGWTGNGPERRHGLF